MRTMHTSLAIILAGAAASLAAAQTTAPSVGPAVQRGVVSSSVRPELATLMKMNRRMTLKVEDTRLEDVLKFIEGVTQADMEVFWTSDNNGVGLDKEKKITLDVKNQPALYVLEAVLDKAKADTSQENSWQMNESGAIEIGPKEALNKKKRVVVYDINDLLMTIPRYAEVPQIDLQNVLQSNQGGGGSSPFTGGQNNQNPLDKQPTQEERAKKIMDLLTSLVESPQWQDNGGEGASMHFFNGTLIVNAPDYIHRGISGYSYWSAGMKRIAARPGQRRYVTLNMDTGIGTVERIRNVPVTATVGGGGGGGGNGP